MVPNLPGVWFTTPAGDGTEFTIPTGFFSTNTAKGRILFFLSQRGELQRNAYKRRTEQDVAYRMEPKLRKVVVKQPSQCMKTESGLGSLAAHFYTDAILLAPEKSRDPRVWTQNPRAPHPSQILGPSLLS